MSEDRQKHEDEEDDRKLREHLERSGYTEKDIEKMMTRVQDSRDRIRRERRERGLE